MSNFTTAGLPRPVVTPELDPEEIRLLRINDFVEAMRAGGVAFGVENLHGHPAAMAIRTAANGDFHYLQRLNDMARTVILHSFATGSDLDLHAVRAGIARAPGQSDEALRERIRLAYKGKSAAGADDYYRSKAFDTDARVSDVAVRAETRNASERVLVLSVLTNDNGGTAPPDLLAKLTAALNEPSFRQRSITVEVVPAVIRVQPVTATIWLYPQAIQPADGARALREAFALDQRLGFDLTRSYVEKHLHTTGVQRVELQGWADADAGFDEAIGLGEIALTYRRLAS